MHRSRLGRLAPFYAPDSGAGGPLPETAQQIEESATDVTDALERMAQAFERIAPHLEKLVSEGLQLHPVEAVKQVPEAAGEAATGAGEAAGEVAGAAGHAVAAAPAVATDTLDTAGAAGSTVVRKATRYTLRKRRG